MPQRLFWHKVCVTKFIWIYLDLLGFVWIFLDLFEFSWIYLKLLGARNSPNIFNFWKFPAFNEFLENSGIFHFWRFPSFFPFLDISIIFSEFSEIYLLFTELTSPIWNFWIFFRIFLEPPWIFYHLKTFIWLCKQT